MRETREPATDDEIVDTVQRLRQIPSALTHDAAALIEELREEIRRLESER